MPQRRFRERQAAKKKGNMINDEIREIIENNTFGLVATVTPEGRPSVSPKATFAILDDKTLAFSNIRSPGTIRNIQYNPNVEVNFVDIFHRTAARIAGTARYIPREDAEYETLLPTFEKWPANLAQMKGFVVIAVDSAEFIKSPSYDIGAKREELSAQWLEHFSGLLK